MDWREFDIHGLASLRVAADAPTEPLISEMFQPFATEGLDHFDLTMTKLGEPIAAPVFAEDRYKFSSNQLQMRSPKISIKLEDEKFYLSGRGELLTAALPLLDIILSRRGVAMIHAASISFEGRGVALPAWGGTGKTSALANLVRSGACFMGDDWAFGTHEGVLFGFARPLFIKPHHRSVYPDLFEQRGKLLVPPVFSGALGRLSTSVHPVVTRFPRVAAFSRKWSPEYLTVSPSRAFDKIDQRAPLRLVVLLERFAGSQKVLQEKEAGWMAGRLIGNFHAEMSRGSRDVLTALGATGMVPLPEPFSAKHAVLSHALEKAPCYSLRIPASLKTSDAARQIADGVLEAIGLGLID